MTGTTWAVDCVVRVIDGDTIRIVRSRTIRLDALEVTARDAGNDGAPVRLVHLNTPERGRPGWHEARADLTHWIDTHRPATVVCYEGGGGFDRLLGDLLDANGQSASQYMMIERGWPPYKET